MISTGQRDIVFAFLLRSLAMCSAGIICLICVFVGRESWTAFDSAVEPGERAFKLSHLVGVGKVDDTDSDDGSITAELGDDDAWNPDAWNPANREFNLTPMIFGSLLATFGSALLAAPIGIGVAVFLNYYSPKKFGWVVRRLVEIMAGVPSVVYGLWGLSVLVPLIASISPIEQGQSLLAGILILAFMTVPTIIVAADAAIRSVPTEQVHAAAALGLGTRATVWSIVLPSARFGLLSAVILQFARAIGETMAVLMVCGNIVQTPDSIFAPVRTLTSNIALEMGYADDHHRSILFLSGLVGLVIVAILMFTANAFSKTQRSAR